MYLDPFMYNDVIARIRGANRLFLVTVVVPTLLAIVYFGLIASDIYVSESRFVVRTPDKPATSGVGFLLKSAGFSSAGDEVFAAQEYVISRDALKTLEKDHLVSRAYTRPEVDFIGRFGGFFDDQDFESLFKYYKTKVKAEYDTGTSVASLGVRAYTAQDAEAINRRLLEQSEALVNRLNERGRSDLIRYATTEVEETQRKATDAALSLSEYRNREGVVDPEQQATVQLQLVSKLQDELITSKTQLVQLRAFTPENPQIPVLDARVAGLSKEIQQELGKIAGDRGSLAGRAARYQRLQLESQFADRQLAAAYSSLTEARNEARRKQVYVERIVQPNLPDDAIEPRRWRAILATLVLGLVAWGILTMLLAGMREHKD